MSEQRPESVKAGTNRTRTASAVRPVLWRLHMLGGLLAAPLLLVLAATGILYAWNPQIEHLLHREALSAVSQGPARPLSEQVTAVRAAHPDQRLISVVPAAPHAAGGEETTAVELAPRNPESNRFEKPRGAFTVYVDPASAEVTGRIIESERPDEWLRNLHSNLRLGKWAEPISELAASWLLVSILTGVVLWWPRDRASAKRLLRFRTSGRARRRTVHALVGATTSIGLVLLVLTGLTWSTYAGAWIDLGRSWLDSPTPTVSARLTGPTEHAEGESGAGAVDRSAAASIDRVVASARGAGLDGTLIVEPPDRTDQAWTVGHDDNRWPVEPTEVAVHPETGRIIDRVDWNDYPWHAKATTLGIDFHQAQLFGTANRILLTGLAVALMALVFTGYRMWWTRRPEGGPGALPSLTGLVRQSPVTVLVALGALMVLLPVLGVFLLLQLALERLGAGRLLRAFRRG